MDHLRFQFLFSQQLLDRPQQAVCLLGQAVVDVPVMFVDIVDRDQALFAQRRQVEHCRQAAADHGLGDRHIRRLVEQIGQGGQQGKKDR